MIAVFCEKEIDFLSLRLTPRSQFKRILSTEDIRGRRFSGVITFPNEWLFSSSVTDALEELKIRQPELFTL